MSEAKTGTPPVALFQGYNAVTGNGYNTAVTGSFVNTGGSSSVKCRVCTDVESLSQALEIDESLSISYGPIGSMNQKMSYVNNLNITSTSVTIVVYARHVSGVKTRTDVALKDDAKLGEGTEGLKEFFQKYGDSFISSITTGGEYYATYTYYSQTKDEQTSITSSLTASGIIDGVSVDASLSTKWTSATSSKTTQTNFQQGSSGLANVSYPDQAHMVDFACKFPSMAIDAPSIIGITSQGYEQLLGSRWAPIATVRSYFTGDNIMSGLTASLVQLQLLRNKINQIKDIHQFYGYTDDKLRSNSNVADSDLKQIHTQIIAYDSDPTQTFTTPELPSLKLGTPYLDYDFQFSAAHGGEGGDAFDDLHEIGLNTYLNVKTWIKSVQPRTGGRTDRLVTTYQNTQTSYQFGRGGGGGSDQAVLDLSSAGGSTDRINHIWGRSGGRVDQINLSTARSGTTGGGGGGGDPYDWQPNEGYFLIGFKGRCAAELDKIQFVSAKLNPTVWRQQS